MVGDYYYEGAEDYDDGIFWRCNNILTKALLRHHFINVIRLIREEKIIPCDVFLDELKRFVIRYHKEKVKCIFLKQIVSELLSRKMIDLTYLSYIIDYLHPIQEQLSSEKFHIVTYHR